MLRSSKDLLDLAIDARADDTHDDTHDDIGDVKDLFFDDEAWTIRYLVVETGSWLFSRKVLISPNAAGKPDWTARRLPVSLTREQIKDSPDIDADMPVTRQRETEDLDDYSYPYYWGGMGRGGTGLLGGRSAEPDLLPPGDAGYGSAPAARADADAAQARTEARQRHQDPHLRSCKAVVGYAIEASDGEIGHVQGLLVDEDSWAIRYLVVSTGNWWKGHEVLVAPQWIQRVSWAERSVAVDLTREALQQAPWYDPASPLSRETEVAVFKHHGRAGYWPGAASDEASASDLAVTHRAV